MDINDTVTTFYYDLGTETLSMEWAAGRLAGTHAYRRDIGWCMDGLLSCYGWCGFIYCLPHRSVFVFLVVLWYFWGYGSPGCNTSEKGMMSCGWYRAKYVRLRRDAVTEAIHTR